ncbi:MAG: hypothetical protein ACUVR4_15230, partial [Anaerolineae bacterium]
MSEFLLDGKWRFGCPVTASVACALFTSRRMAENCETLMSELRRSCEDWLFKFDVSNVDTRHVGAHAVHGR